jgi:hypothetical protein
VIPFGGAAQAAPPSQPMTRLCLRPHLSFCSIDGCAVLLDIDRNRYFALPEPANHALHKLWHAGGESRGIAGIDTLLRFGIVEPGRAGGTLPVPAKISVPPRSLVERAPVCASGVGPLLPIWLHVVRTRREIARGRFAGLYSRLEAVEPRPTAPVERIECQIAAFRAARRLVPIAPNCLLDSIALFHYLSRHRMHANLVIGVRLDPFSAHCWLQTRDWVLNDPAEHAMTMTPILEL